MHACFHKEVNQYLPFFPSDNGQPWSEFMLHTVQVVFHTTARHSKISLLPCWHLMPHCGRFFLFHYSLSSIRIDLTQLWYSVKTMNVSTHILQTWESCSNLPSIPQSQCRIVITFYSPMTERQMYKASDPLLQSWFTGLHPMWAVKNHEKCN